MLPAESLWSPSPLPKPSGRASQAGLGMRGTLGGLGLTWGLSLFEADTRSPRVPPRVTWTVPLGPQVLTETGAGSGVGRAGCLFKKGLG